MFDWTGKFLPGSNTLAYLALSSVTMEKSFITLIPGVPVPDKSIQPSPIFASKTGA